MGKRHFFHFYHRSREGDGRFWGRKEGGGGDLVGAMAVKKRAREEQTVNNESPQTIKTTSLLGVARSYDLAGFYDISSKWLLPL